MGLAAASRRHDDQGPLTANGFATGLPPGLLLNQTVKDPGYDTKVDINSYFVEPPSVSYLFICLSALSLYNDTRLIPHGPSDVCVQGRGCIEKL